MTEKVDITFTSLWSDPIIHSSLKHKSRSTTKTNCFCHHHCGILLCPKERQTSGEEEVECLDLLKICCGKHFSEVKTVVTISDRINSATFPKHLNSREWVTAVLLNENCCSMLNIASCSNQMTDNLSLRMRSENHALSCWQEPFLESGTGSRCTS